jgi:hypothetical protein
VRIVHEPTGVQAQCQDHRSRERNLADALKRLRIRLAASIRGKSDPTWIGRYRQGTRLRLTPNAREFHLVAAACLDALDASAGSLPAASATLLISTSQLAKLLGSDPEVHGAADSIRTRHGLCPVKI